MGVDDKLERGAKVFTTRQLEKTLSKCNHSSVRHMNVRANEGAEENVVASG